MKELSLFILKLLFSMEIVVVEILYVTEGTVHITDLG